MTKKKNIVTHTTFSHLQPARVDDLAQTLHRYRARRAHPKRCHPFLVCNPAGNNAGSMTVLAGDFSAGGVDWEAGVIPPGTKQSSICQKVLDVCVSHRLEQQQRLPTREGCVLDLFCTNQPGLLVTLHSDRAGRAHHKRCHPFFDPIPTHSFSYRVHGKIWPNLRARFGRAVSVQ